MALMIDDGWRFKALREDDDDGFAGRWQARANSSRE
jgi:hypothetical protein